MFHHIQRLMRWTIKRRNCLRQQNFYELFANSMKLRLLPLQQQYFTFIVSCKINRRANL